MVSDGFEKLGNGLFLSGQAHIGIIGLVLRVALKTEALLIATGNESGPRWTAYRIGNVPARTTHPVCGNRIDIGCRDILAPIETNVRIPQIIAHNHDHVWLRRFPVNRKGKKNKG